MPMTEETYAKRLGAAIKAARIARGETQEQTARNMGVPLRAFSRWETGANAPRGASELIVFRYFGWPHRLLDDSTNNVWYPEIPPYLRELPLSPGANRAVGLVDRTNELVAVGGA